MEIHYVETLIEKTNYLYVIMINKLVSSGPVK